MRRQGGSVWILCRRGVGCHEQRKDQRVLAASRDGGATFSPPVQVNAVAGEARLGGELPPRVSLISRTGRTIPETVVLWTARGERTEIKAARSLDGGKTSASPIVVQGNGARATAAGRRSRPTTAVLFTPSGSITVGPLPSAPPNMYTAPARPTPATTASRWPNDRVCITRRFQAANRPQSAH